MNDASYGYHFAATVYEAFRPLAALPLPYGACRDDHGQGSCLGTVENSPGRVWRRDLPNVVNMVTIV